MYVRTYVRMYVCMDGWIDVCVCMYVCICVYMCMYVYIYIYTYTCVLITMPMLAHGVSRLGFCSALFDGDVRPVSIMDQHFLFRELQNEKGRYNALESSFKSLSRAHGVSPPTGTSAQYPSWVIQPSTIATWHWPLEETVLLSFHLHPVSITIISNVRFAPRVGLPRRPCVHYLR